MGRDESGRLVVLNRATGRWHIINRTGAEVVDRLVDGVDIDRVAALLAQRHTGVSVEQVREDVVRLVDGLVRRGLLELRPERGTSAVLMSLPGYEEAAPTATHRIAAVVALPVALVLLRLPFRAQVRAVAVGKSLLGARDADDLDVRRCLSAVRWAGTHYPGRFACLEQSLTAVLTAALLRRRADWCFGFSSDPTTMHAWVEAGGHPVTGVLDAPLEKTYRKVYAV
ncbi:hypothetical protein BU204_10825 [Actinophytocola xanthii]|uniref:Microcin J25-processing protein McjB C-terminal domain-containing protein n=2 Tax=Actinophytocola xanthii TaxID=1912961 RepID=A0A1Q8CT57_9PSEU|nr:hypothetical protein BU204_10825 [Actinophytocola xanthii]